MRSKRSACLATAALAFRKYAVAIAAKEPGPGNGYAVGRGGI